MIYRWAVAPNTPRPDTPWVTCEDDALTPLAGWRAVQPVVSDEATWAALDMTPGDQIKVPRTLVEAIFIPPPSGWGFLTPRK